MNVLAVSGSLRAASINSAFCRVAAQLAVAPLRISVYSRLGDLPLFNPDLESSPPSSVQDFRFAVGRADAVLLASPEYAHGISGVMKNALDWLVSYEGTVYKPIALINTSPRAHHAYEAMREILRTISTTLIESASVSIPLLGSCITEEAMLAAPEVRHAIQSVLAAIAAHLAGHNASGPSFPLT
jgi:NAD(P)H-dependent FMN reductase